MPRLDPSQSQRPSIASSVATTFQSVQRLTPHTVDDLENPARTQPSRPASGHGSTTQRPFTLPSVPSSCSRRPESTTRPSPDSRALTLHLTRCNCVLSQAVCPFDSALALTILLGAARHRTIRLTLHSRGRPRCSAHAHFSTLVARQHSISFIPQLFLRFRLEEPSTPAKLLRKTSIAPYSSAC